MMKTVSLAREAEFEFFLLVITAAKLMNNRKPISGSLSLIIEMASKRLPAPSEFANDEKMEINF